MKQEVTAWEPSASVLSVIHATTFGRNGMLIPIQKMSFRFHFVRELRGVISALGDSWEIKEAAMWRDAAGVRRSRPAKQHQSTPPGNPEPLYDRLYEAPLAL